MSNSLAYSVGGGGLGRLDKEIDFKGLKQKSVFKKATYIDPLKRLSLSKKGSNSRSNSVDTPPEQPPSTTTSATSPSITTKTPEPTTNSTSTTTSPPRTIDPNAQISYHSLDASSPNPQLSAILSLSNTIFSSSTTSAETKYSSLPHWQSHLTSPTSIIFFATTPSPSPTADVDPIAFVFAFPRSPAEYSPTTTQKLSENQVEENRTEEILHIWLAGVLPAYRGHGIFAELMNLVEMHAREKGLGKMSVATFPERFGDMYRILVKKGWVEVERVDGPGEGAGGQEKEGQEGKVVLMKDVHEKGGVEE